MKITIERPSYKNIITIEEDGDDFTLPRLIELLIIPALKAMEFSSETIEKYFDEPRW